MRNCFLPLKKVVAYLSHYEDIGQFSILYIISAEQFV